MSTLQRNLSARRDFRTYALLFLGLVFTGAGLAVDPAANCDESGRNCAPWLVHVALWIGIATTLSGFYLLLRNPRWGSRLDADRRCIEWWDTRRSPETQLLRLDDVARIKVRPSSDGPDQIFFYDRSGTLLPFPPDEVLPAGGETWARDLAARFPHIAVEVEG